MLYNSPHQKHTARLVRVQREARGSSVFCTCMWSMCSEWDVALDQGVFGTCIPAVLRFLSLHSNSDGSCPVPNCSFYIGHKSPCAHFLSTHANLNTSLDSLISTCVSPSNSLFQHGKCCSCFKSLYD